MTKNFKDMKIAGVIAEFNPFHNGHAYLLSKIKELTSADAVIVIQSGNFTQRGTPAMIDKSKRAKMALLNGADVVLELPTAYAVSSAEFFAKSAIGILDSLECVDFLCFGHELGSTNDLLKLSDILFFEPDLYKNALKSALKSGDSFPAARKKAVAKYCLEEGIKDPDALCCLLDTPNNILALEYLKALKYHDSNIKPIGIKRIGTGYNSKIPSGKYASATAIREMMEKDLDFLPYVPKNCHSIFKNLHPLFQDDFSYILGYALTYHDDYSSYFDVSKELANRIVNFHDSFFNTSDLICSLQSKNFTYSTISRALCHIMLGITKSDVNLFEKSNYTSDVRLLGFKKDTPLLSKIKSRSKINIIEKFARYTKSNNSSERLFDICIKADNLYRQVYAQKYSEKLPSEFERQIVIV